MRLPFLVLVLTACLAVPAAAQSQDAIRSVIERQLDAFQRDDGSEAFSYASPTIQRKFRTPETFMRMVRSGYPQVYRPQAVQFEGLTAQDDGRVVQEVFFVGPDGGGSLALYFMERQPDGSWKIDGVRLTRLPDATT
jgi:hypothetical protein